MTAINTTWLLGSFTLASNATIVINGSNAVIAADTYYLHHATAALSLRAAIQTALQVHVASVSVILCKDRKLRITAGVALTLTIPASLQAVTGLVGAPAVGTTVAAASISTLLWSPGYPETAVNAPSGITGREIWDRVQTASATGQRTRTTLHSKTVVGSWLWRSITIDRVWTTDAGLGGEYRRFWSDVLNPGMRFMLLPGSGLVEDSTVTTTVTYPTALGPYVAHDLEGDWYQRDNAQSDTWATIGLTAHVVEELT